MTTLPPLCSPANPSRSPLALLLLLAARGAFPVSVAPLMNTSTELLPHAHGDNFSRPGELEPISVPTELEPISAPYRACLSPSGRRSGHRIWLRKKVPRFRFRRTSS